MPDTGYYDQSYPPSLYTVQTNWPPPGIYIPPSHGQFTGTWVIVTSGGAAGNGEVDITKSAIKMHVIDNSDVDHTADIAALKSGDHIVLIGAAGHVEITLSGTPAVANGVATLAGTEVATGTRPGVAEAVRVHLAAAPPPDPAPPPDDDLFDPTDHTVGEVKDHLAANPDDAHRILHLEESGKNRGTLVDYIHDHYSDDL